MIKNGPYNPYKGLYGPIVHANMVNDGHSARTDRAEKSETSDNRQNVAFNPELQMDWKARVAELKKLKRPRSYGENATKKQIDAYFNKTAEINKIEDAFYDDLLKACGPSEADHWFVELGNDWFWISTDGAVGGRIHNVVKGLCKDDPEMWRLAIDANPGNKEEMNTLFLDNATMLQWSDIHCMVRTGVCKEIKV